MTVEDVIVRMGWGTASDLDVAPLGGGITNLNFRVRATGGSYVVRIPGKDSMRLGIDREREHACTIAAAVSGVSPEVVAFFEDAGVLVTRFVDGRALTTEEIARPETLRRVARTIRRYHGGPVFPGTFSPFRAVGEYLAFAIPRGAPVPERFDWMLQQARRLEAALGNPPVLRPCHNDLLLANWLDDGQHLWLLDWEYAAMGDIFFDLGNFAVHHQLSDEAEQTMLAAYFASRLPVPDYGLARLKLMKIISDLREAMWAMVQVTISELDYDFMAYGKKHFDRYVFQLMAPRLETWLEQVAVDKPPRALWEDNPA